MMEFDAEHDANCGHFQEAAALAARLMQLEEAVQEFLDYEDGHKPGPYIKDGNWIPGITRERNPDGFLSCADEDCMLYWPCPVERLRRAYEGEE